MNGGEKILVLVPSIVHGVIFTIANLEGQCATFSLVLMGILIGTCTVIMKLLGEKIAINNRPFYMFLVLQFLVMLAFLLVWGFVLGVKPWYPFFFEPSEI